MADKILNENEMKDTEVSYDDAAIVAEEKARREAQREEDLKKPFDPEALLEVRHLQKSFPNQSSQYQP